MIFVPSRGRRKSLERFFRESRPVCEGRVLVDEDDVDTYLGMDMPSNWRLMGGERVGAAGSIERARGSYPEEAWYGVVGDDCVCSEGWDEVLSEACLPDRVAWGDDGKFGERMGTTFFVGGELVRRMGWLAHPGFGHLYVDRIWAEIAHGSGLRAYCPGVKTAHFNVRDETYRQRAVGKDHEVFPTIDLGELIERAGRVG